MQCSTNVTPAQYLACVAGKKCKKNAQKQCEADLEPCALEKLQDASVTVLKALAASIGTTHI